MFIFTWLRLSASILRSTLITSSALVPFTIATMVPFCPCLSRLVRMGQCKNLRGKFINCYLSSKKQIRPPPSLSAWQRYHSFWHVLLWETTLFSLLFYITFLFELEVQTGFQFFIDFSDSLQNGVYSTTKIRSFSSIKFKFMLLVFFFYILD